MITIELLKKYAEQNTIHQYQKGDDLGKLYALIRDLIVEWERAIKKGITVGLPLPVEEKSLELATRFIKVHKFGIGKKERTELLQKISEWCLSKVQEYYHKRMRELGATDEDLLTTVVDSTGEYQTSVFYADMETGDIRIVVTSLYGDLIRYSQPNEKNPEYPKLLNYEITRFCNPIGNRKYGIPKDAGVYPFFPEKLKKAYRNKYKVSTLFLTEGAFKAFKGSLHDLFVVGLSSITHYRDKYSTKEKPQLHADIIEFIKVCQVENVVILWDGDCRNIDVKDLELEQEITSRPNRFFKAAKTARDLVTKSCKNVKVYYSTIRTESINGKPKGLDDLLVCMEKEGGTELKTCIKQALSLESKPNRFFYFCNITKDTSTLLEYFLLGKTKETATKFRTRYQDIIGEKEFIFKGTRYRYSEVKGELITLQPDFLKDVRFIGDNFYKVVDMPTSSKNGKIQLIKQLTPFRKGTLQDLYGKNFVDYLKDKHYTGFCNIPSHFEYQREIEYGGSKFYNRYFPFEHSSEKGSCENILDFFGHIFQDQKEMGLDYVQILLNNPSKKLPVLILYSALNNTGKSIFCNLLSQIFKNNAVFINNDDLKSEFGLDRFADKLLAICEETLLDRKKDVERVKMVTTALEPILCNPKGFSSYQIYTYVKMIFCSNNLRMIHATEHDERFWIINIPKPKEPDVNLLDKMKAEIPAFIHYLQNRKMSTEEKGRMWFASDLIKTDILKAVVRVNEHTDVQELRSRIEDYFIDFPKETKLMLSTKDLIDEFMPGKARAWMEEICNARLGLEKYQKNGVTVVKRSYLMKKITFMTESNEVQYRDKKEGKPPQRVWVFKREDFTSEDLEYENESDNLLNDVA